MKKRIADLSPEEQERVRKYNREQKQKSRAKQKDESHIPSADEWTWNWSENFPEQYRELNAFEQEFSAKVYQELGRGEFHPYSSPEAETLSWVAITSYCLRKKDSPWVREVENPNGILVGGLFYPDTLGTDLVANTHHFGLETSATYVALYRELLRTLDKKFGHEQTEAARDIKAELAGTYVLPQLPELPKAEPKKIQEAPSVPSDAETLEQRRTKLLDQLKPQFRVHDPNVSPDARRYLDGTL
jgi:hypothetical protein